MPVTIYQLIDTSKIVHVIYSHNPYSTYLEFSGPTSYTYKTVTQWCGPLDKLTLLYNEPTMTGTHNGVLFVPTIQSFVDLSDSFFDEFEYHCDYILETIFPLEYLEDVQVRGTFLNLSGSIDETLAQKLIDSGALGPPLTINWPLI